jgi:hypothetical protein
LRCCLSDGLCDTSAVGKTGGQPDVSKALPGFIVERLLVVAAKASFAYCQVFLEASATTKLVVLDFVHEAVQVVVRSWMA